MPLSSSNAAAIACYAEPIVNDAEIVPSPLRRRLENDPWARTLGIEFLDVRRGHCRLRLQLRSHMVNFQGYPHGGVIVTSEAVQVAEAHKVKQGRRAGFYQMSVATQDGRAIAHIETGRSRPCVA